MTRTLHYLLPLVLVATGCKPITAVGDKIIGLTNPVLVGGVVLGSAPPDDPRLQAALELAGFTGFTDARLVVADALEFQDIDEALIEDAVVDLLTDSTDVSFTPDENGWFAPSGGAFLPYTPGATVTVRAELPDRVLPGTVDVPLPDIASIDVDPVHPPGEPLTVDLTGQGFDYAFAVVYDLDGNEVFSNAPSTNEDIVDLVLPAADPVETVEIPGEFFDQDEVYVVGLAGLKRAPTENIEGLNEALTAILAGRLSLFPVISGSPMVTNTLIVDAVEPDPVIAPLVAAAGIPTGLTVELQASDLLLAGDGLEGASVLMNGTFLEELEDGRYRVEGAPSEADGSLSMEINASTIEDIGRVELDVPPPTEAEFPATFPPNFDLYVPTPGGPWRAVLVTVVNETGVVWSNVPGTAEEWSFVMRSDASMEQTRIPAVAFPTAGTYAIGIAALQSFPDSTTNINPRFSNVMAGSLDYFPLVVQ